MTLYAVDVTGIVWGSPMPDPPEVIVPAWFIDRCRERKDIDPTAARILRQSRPI